MRLSGLTTAAGRATVAAMEAAVVAALVALVVLVVVGGWALVHRLDKDRITAYVEQRGTPVMVDFNRRFDRDHAELRRIVADGELGEVELVQLSSRGPVVPPLSYVAVSGGQMRDQTVHFFDLARWLVAHPRVMRLLLDDDRLARMTVEDFDRFLAERAEGGRF